MVILLLECGIEVLYLGIRDLLDRVLRSVPSVLEKFLIPRFRERLQLFNSCALESLETLLSRSVLWRRQPVNASSLFSEDFVVLPDGLDRRPVQIISAIRSPRVSLPCVT